MTRLPLQHHRHRLPAIPPRLGPMTQTFSFDVHEARMGRGSNGWKDFLRHLGGRDDGRDDVPFTETGLRHLREFAERKHGMEVRWTAQDFGNEITITVRSAKPRISAKLLAAFPWKLRKFLKP